MNKFIKLWLFMPIIVLTSITPSFADGVIDVDIKKSIILPTDNLNKIFSNATDLTESVKTVIILHNNDPIYIKLPRSAGTGFTWSLASHFSSIKINYLGYLIDPNRNNNQRVGFKVFDIFCIDVSHSSLVELNDHKVIYFQLSRLNAKPIRFQSLSLEAVDQWPR